MIANSFNPAAEVPDLSDAYSLTEHVWNFFKCFHLHSMTRYAFNYVGRRGEGLDIFRSVAS